MGIRMRTIRAIACALVVIVTISITACTSKKDASDTGTLRIWYCEDAMSEYLKQAAAEYEKKTGVHVECVKKDSAQYLEQVRDVSLNSEKELPDVYLLRNDELGKACMEGVAAPNRSAEDAEKIYCETALRAATYQSTLMAYPLYYNTVCFLTNTDYFQKPPATMGAVVAFSETEQINENIQYILYWDVNDYLCNYAFVGKYINAGGENGDDVQSLSVYNDQVLQCLQKFYEIGQYFAIDSETIRPEDVPQALMEGRALCILANSNMVHEINWYASNHNVQIPYHISPVPAITDELESGAGSYTELAVVNGLGLQQEKASQLAQFLTDGFVEHLYDTTGHFAAKKGVSYSNKELENLYDVYERSNAFPKLLESEDSRVWLEVMFSNIRSGSGIAQELQGYADKMAARMNK